MVCPHLQFASKKNFFRIQVSLQKSRLCLVGGEFCQKKRISLFSTFPSEKSRLCLVGGGLRDGQHFLWRAGAPPPVPPHPPAGWMATIYSPPHQNVLFALSKTRSVGALRAPTSSWRPFEPLDFVLLALRCSGRYVGPA